MGIATGARIAQLAAGPARKLLRLRRPDERRGHAHSKIDIALISVARLADMARQDADFMQVGELYRNDPAFDIHRLVAELVEAESVPLLPVLRYKA